MVDLKVPISHLLHHLSIVSMLLVLVFILPFSLISLLLSKLEKVEIVSFFLPLWVIILIYLLCIIAEYKDFRMVNEYVLFLN